MIKNVNETQQLPQSQRLGTIKHPPLDRRLLSRNVYFVFTDC